MEFRSEGRQNMNRFAILTHDVPVLHWDLLLESGELCRTWRLAEEPSHGDEIAAEQIADHRQKYLSYEGPVSKNRGNVVRWDSGSYRIILEIEGEIVLNLSGQRFRGECRLCRIAGESWLVIFHCEEEAEIKGD